MKKNIFESPLWGSISALLSGLITSLVIPLLSTTNFEYTIDGKKYFINQIPGSLLETLGKVILTLFVFGLLWTTLAFIPDALRRRFCYWKKKTYSNKDICKLIDKSVKQLMDIAECRKNTVYYLPPETFWRLKLKELASIIQVLYCAFISENSRSKRRIGDYFRRNHESILGNQTSLYQVIGLINGIDLFLNEAEVAAEKENLDSLLKSDCQTLREKINCLKEITKWMIKS